MSDGEVLILGAIAGFTIFLGLPMGRVKNPSLALKAFLNAVAVGLVIQIFEDGLTLRELLTILPISATQAAMVATMGLICVVTLDCRVETQSILPKSTP